MGIPLRRPGATPEVTVRIVSVVGARPQFVKAAAVTRALRARPGVTETLVHTGQHYDPEMSDVFFSELGLPEPDRELGVGSGTHAVQTGAMLVALEKVFTEEQPDLVLIYGDTNTTLAAALVAAKMVVPIGHVEAGMRSFNRTMPEEVNRVCADHIAALHFCPTQTSVDNLRAEGVTEGVHLVGDVMADLVRLSFPYRKQSALDDAGVTPGAYYVLTLHRPANTDDPERLETILRAVAKLDAPVVFPVHPRTLAAMEAAGIRGDGALRPMRPAGYLAFLALQASARAVLTDSGGIQKEAYVLGVPCVTLRGETEWPETIESGWNLLADADPDAIIAGATRDVPPKRPDLYGDGRAAVWHHAHIRAGAKIGAECVVGKGVYVGAGVTVGHRCKIQNAAMLFEGSVVEDGVFVGPGAQLANDRFPRAVTADGDLKGPDDWQLGHVTVERGASIGAGAIVVPNARIGEWAMVGAGAVVTRDVAAHELVTGNPAHHAGYVCSCGQRLENDPSSGSWRCASCGRTFDLAGARP